MITYIFFMMITFGEENGETFNINLKKIKHILQFLN